MKLELIGPHPFERGEDGKQMARIGTLFLGPGVLYTRLPAVHACQRADFIDLFNARRAEQGLPCLTVEEEQALVADSVDLIIEPDHILVRPDPERTDQAFAADELLQQLVSKRQIMFLSVADRRVREAIKRRGECWRLSRIPKTRKAKERLVMGSRVGIAKLPIYFYNRLTGTRWLTYQSFESLGALDDAQLCDHLQEIADHTLLRNRLGRPEVDFFAADLRRFGARDLAGINYSLLNSQQLRSKFEELRQSFRAAVHEGLRQDDGANKAWCERMLSTLFLEGNETQTEQLLGGLSPEFFLQIEWLPGGRFEEGEFLFDPLFDEAAEHPEDAGLQHLCDLRTKGIIFNLIRDYGDLEYINVGTLPESLSLDRPMREGRRAVYLAELGSRSERNPIRRFMRLQKWGIWEHLDENKNLLQAMEESDEYTDYWLDRRLGCRQLGMNLTRRVVMRQLREMYTGCNEAYRGQNIRTTYFEREYLDGIASDKLPIENYHLPGYALKLAHLLGHAAASNLIVGRALESGARPVFDDGDEVVCEGEAGVPEEILVGDHSGAFGDYQRPFETFAAYYARPVHMRAKFLPDARAFAQIYIDALREEFLQVQSDYRKRRRAFDTLFKHCRYDRQGSFAYRWECILRRLDQANADAIVDAIRKEIWVLNPPAAAQPATTPA
jgi:hypothetical protein